MAGKSRGRKAEKTEASADDLVESEIRKIIEVNRAKNCFHFAGLFSSLFFLVVFVLIGLPIWWKTTTLERWSLPDVSALMVRSQTLTHYYQISVVILDHDSNGTMFDLGRLKNWLQNNHARRQSFDGSLSFVNDWTVRRAFEKERRAYDEAVMRTAINAEKENLIDILDEKFSSTEMQTRNSVIFYVLPRGIRTDSFVTRGQYRAFFIDLNFLPAPAEDESEDVHSVFGGELNRHLQSAQNIVEQFYAYQPTDNDQNIMLLLARDFDFLFDIIYEDENDDHDDDDVSGKANYLDAHKTRHRRTIADIDELIDAFYTDRFHFSQYFKINFITQILHYLLPQDFVSRNLSKIPPSGDNNNNNNATATTENGERLLPTSIAHSMLNLIESNRVEHDNEKSYHLTLYIASGKNGPLHFYDEKRDSKSNLLITPFRGSILILNPNHDGDNNNNNNNNNNNQYRNAKHDLFNGFHRLMRHFFRLNRIGAERRNGSKYFFTQIEIESIVHALAQKHILLTLNSLESIEKLLTKVSNMVIKEKIADRMHKSMQDSMLAADLLGGEKNGADIRRAYEHSWSAYSLSEKAFFDQSLLSLLYFPDDQKYAIYLPLFLPICLPLVSNLRIYVRLWNYLYGKKDKTKKD